MDAFVGIDKELPVGNHPAIKVGSYDMAERPGCQSAMGMGLAFHAFSYHFHILPELLFGLGNFLMLTLRGVSVHERQAYIAFGHDKREGTVDVKRMWSQFLLEHLDGASDTVATSADGVDVGL